MIDSHPNACPAICTGNHKSEVKSQKMKDLQARTRSYALRIIRLYDELPKSNPAKTIGNQILRSGTSVGANYAESCRARSDADFINKHEICLQELEETLYWIDLLIEAGIKKQELLVPLHIETEELIAIFITIIKRTKSRQASGR